MEEFLGPQGEYNEEEEERKYYRRKRLGVVKNVGAASVGAMMVYSVYMGECDGADEGGAFENATGVSGACVRALQVCCRCSSSSITT